MSNNEKQLKLEDLLKALPANASTEAFKLEQLPKAKAIPAPLAPRLQARKQRKKAYQDNKQELTAWEPVVVQHRQADHLQFGSNGRVVSKRESSDNYSSNAWLSLDSLAEPMESTTLVEEVEEEGRKRGLKGEAKNAEERAIKKMQKATVNKAEEKGVLDVVIELNHHHQHQQQQDQEQPDNERTKNEQEQAELLKMAFANDNALIVKEFEKEQDEALLQELGQEDLSKDRLPGWGSWGGKGLKEKITKKRQNQQQELLRQAKLRKKSQGLGHVIINEKRDKKAKKYQVTATPFPFTDPTHYSLKMRTPLGKEWNTQSAFQKLNLPRVTTKSGVVIQPLARSDRPPPPPSQD